jgi:adenylate cyclase
LAGKGVERRLAAILAADVVGYSRLMEADEEATIRALSTCRQNIEELVANHHGRVFGGAGDSVIAEFTSAVEAVRCAAEIQRYQETQGADLPEDRRMRLRVGINLGDMVVEDGNLLGDGVNVAARLEGLAEPGGLCISANIHEQVAGKLDLVFDDLGDQKIKNITRPVRVYRACFDNPIGTSAASSSEPLPLPDKPSVAVLPFTNMSGDPEQEFFGDGLAEDIITTLSKISSLFVIARTSSFAFKGQAKDVRDIAANLGVRYVLEGSVRQSANRLRINAQLIDAVDGHHLWAERYDRQRADIFDIQDEMMREIVTALRLKLSDGEQSQIWLRGTENVDAWLNAMQALELAMRGSRVEMAQARDLFQQAVDADPNYGFALAWVGITHWFDVRFGFSNSPAASAAQVSKLAARVLEHDSPEPYALMLEALDLGLKGKFDEAVELLRQAVALSPNDAFVKAALSRHLIFAGYRKEGEVMVREAMRLNPFYPNYYLGMLGNALEQMGRYDEAIETLRAAIVRDPRYFSAHLRLASLFALTGHLEEAKFEVTEILRLAPQYNLSRAASFYLTTDLEMQQRFIEGLRKAGLPE